MTGRPRAGPPRHFAPGGPSGPGPVCQLRLSPAAKSAVWSSIPPPHGRASTSDVWSTFPLGAVPAIFEHFVYVGNRSDGSNSCGDLNSTGPVIPVPTPTNPDGPCVHVNPGILIGDIDDPPRPGGRRRVTTSTAGVAIKPHEFYLWVHPKDEDRALWESTPSASAAPKPAELGSSRTSATCGGRVGEARGRGQLERVLPGVATRRITTSTLPCTRWRPRQTGRSLTSPTREGATRCWTQARRLSLPGGTNGTLGTRIPAGAASIENAPEFQDHVWDDAAPAASTPP